MTRPPHRLPSPLKAFALLLACLLAVPACRDRKESPLPEKRRTPTPSPAPPTFDLWYQIRVDGQNIGYRSLRLSAASDPLAGPLRLESDQRLYVGTQGQKHPRRNHLSERCGLDGRLLHLTAEWGVGRSLQRSHYWVKGRSLRRLDPTTGTTRTLPLKKDQPLYGLCAVYLAMWRHKPGLTLRTLDGRTGRITEGSLVQSAAPDGRTYRYTEADHPGTRTTFTLGRTRVPERITIASPTRTFQLRLTTRQEALKDHPQGRRPKTTGLTVRFHARFPDPLDARLIRYQLTFPTQPPAAALTALNQNFQRLIPHQGKGVQVEVTDPEQGRGSWISRPFHPQKKQGTAPDPKTLRALFPKKNANPRATVAGLVKGATTGIEAARRLTRWVGTHPERATLDRPFLLVTALRLAGLRARLASGLLCVGSLLTEHHWAEVHLGRWVPLDPETHGLGSAAHLRLAAGPDHHTTRAQAYAEWRDVRQRLRGLQARLIHVIFSSGFRFEPGAKKNLEITRNVLTHRAWNIRVRRPLSAKFIIGQPADAFDVGVVSQSGSLRAELALFATQADGLDPGAFRAMGYTPSTLSGRPYLVKATPPRRTYVQFACSTRPWGALLVRWTLHLKKGATPAEVSAFERKVLGGLSLIGRSSTTHACRKAHKPRTRR